MKRIIKILTVFLIAGITGCVQKNISFSIPVISENEMKTELSIKKGDSFRIELESNPTTGYMWYEHHDSQMISLIKSGFVSSSPEKKIVGNPGKQIFVFKAVEKGETVIEFVYKREWEKEIVKKINFKIRIN